jgi:non-specific serine/threonine protein kinase
MRAGTTAASTIEGRVAARESSLRAQREAAEHDVLACGLVLHRLLVGAPALDTSDISRLLERIAPRGREIVRLPWTTPQPIPEALRAIANRSTAAQVRLRYRNARTFLGAIAGWRESAAQDDGGPVALLLDRLHSVGHLPALPGLGRARAARDVDREPAHRRDCAPPPARHGASFELLKTLSSARVQGTQIPGNGPVLTLRRIVALIGVDGVRAAANTLRAWPGAVDGERASALRETIDRIRLAGHLGQALRPAGYDPEAVYLVTALQNLGWLMLRYHFADEAEQIRQLMQPIAALRSDGELVAAEQPGLDEDAAAYAVLGVDVESFGNAAARQWGLGAESCT